MIEFRLICEGQTDHAVIKNILFGYFSDPDLIIKALQPDIDETNKETLKPKHENPPESFGNWYKVFDYCGSERFFRAFDDKNTFFVVQIDTDCADDKNYDVKTKNEQRGKLPVNEVVNNVKQKFENLFIEKFGDDFLDKNKHRILYAISVDEIECWLLPLYYIDQNKAATNNCFYKLNEKWREIGEPIHDNKKGKKSYIQDEPRRKDIKKSKLGEVPTYQKISKSFLENRVLMDKYAQNPSFKIFIENELQIKVPLENKEEKADPSV
jgi:hypothetical protein